MRATRAPTLGLSMRRSERGQATVEWSALGLMLALLFATAAFAVARTDAWRFGDGIVHSIVCAVEGGCEERDSLDLAYGDEVGGAGAALLARTSCTSAAAPRCRSTSAAAARRTARTARTRRAQIDRSRAGLPVTAFTRVVDRRAAGGSLYLQYWFYYPESFTGGDRPAVRRQLAGLSPGRLGGLPGARLARRTRVGARHRARRLRRRLGAVDGLDARVRAAATPASLAQRGAGERSTPASKMALVPLERLKGTSRYGFEVSPPWRKDVYRVPESSAS